MTYDVGFHLDARESLAGLVCMSGRLHKTDDLDASLANHRSNAYTCGAACRRERDRILAILRREPGAKYRSLRAREHGLIVGAVALIRCTSRGDVRCRGKASE